MHTTAAAAATATVGHRYHAQNKNMPSLQIRLKLSKINSVSTNKVNKKDKKKKRKSKRSTKRSSKALSSSSDYSSEEKTLLPSDTAVKSFYWTSERIEPTKFILRTVIASN